ncbi:MAG: response regulator [Pseudomonadales bacterium]|jgi:PAS domain S-box-containing protein|nr:response regulator [Pseudomonadales bacterium]
MADEMAVRAEAETHAEHVVEARTPGVARPEQQLAAFARDLARELDFERRKLAGLERLGRQGTFVADLARNAISFSEGAHELAGVDGAVDPLSFTRWTSLVHEEDRERVADDFRDIVSGVLELHLDVQGEHRIVRPDGRMRWIRTHVEPISDGDGEIDFVIGVLQDVTEEHDARARMERDQWVIEARVRELEQTQRELAKARDSAETASEVRARFLALMDGQMRTPMNDILGVLAMLDEKGLSSRSAEMVRSARSSGEVLRGTLNDMLDLSELEAGVLELEEESFSLRALVEEMVGPWRRRAEEAGLRLEVDVARELPAQVLGDRGRIRQVIGNFLSNAVKFTERGTITLRAFVMNEPRHDDDRAEIQFEVEDSGPGIPEHVRARFVRGWVQPGSGGGLGLALADGLARRMEGSMGFRHAEYRGACFWLRVPLAIDRSVAVDEVAADMDSLPSLLGRAPRVLLAEDVPLNQLIARHLVESFGCEVEVAGNGVEAIRVLENAAGDGAPMDLVLMDVSMPVLDGVGATRRLRARKDDLASVPVIAVTAYVRKEDVERMRGAGIDHCVAKPLDREELREAIYAVLAERVSLEDVGDGDVGAEAEALEDDADITETDYLTRASEEAEDLTEPYAVSRTRPGPADGPVWDAAGPLLDESMLDELFRFLPAENVETMLDGLGDTLYGVVRDAGAAVAQGDADTLGRVVHAVNGCAGNLGAMALTGLAKDIEHAARSGRGAEALRMAERLPGMVRETLAAFSALRARRG